MNLTKIVGDHNSFDGRIVLVNNGNPIGFYFTHRKGWLEPDEKALTDGR